MIGAIIGDIAGSAYEFNNVLSKNFPFFSRGCGFTDDSVMTCAVAQAIMDCEGDYSALSDKAVEEMQAIGRCYPTCGYGAKHSKWEYEDIRKIACETGLSIAEVEKEIEKNRPAGTAL